MPGCIVLAKGPDFLSSNFVESFGAQDQGGIRGAFLLEAFLWRRKNNSPGANLNSQTGGAKGESQGGFS